MLYAVIIAVTLIWGINGLIDRQALASGHPIEVNFLVALTMTFMAFFYLTLAKMSGIPLHFNKQTVLFSCLNGVLIPTSYVIFLFALSQGSLSKVVTITGTYPIITYVLAVAFLHEPVTPSKTVGILFVVIGLSIFVR